MAPRGPGRLAAGAGEPVSARVAQARSRARERGDAARQALWPLGWAFIAIVVTASVQAHPVPGLRGAGLGVTLALAVYAAAVATAVTPGWARRGLAAQAVVIGLIGGAGVALAAWQPHGPVELAAPMGVWIAAVRLPPAPAAAAAGSDHGRARRGRRPDGAPAGPVGHHRDAGVPAAGGDGPVHPARPPEPGPHRTADGPAPGRARGRGRRGRAGRAQPHRRRAA